LFIDSYDTRNYYSNQPRKEKILKIQIQHFTMKFFFAKTDSLYKIFKSLEKIPSHRSVEIFIDPEHALFDNEWW
jgi:hypothetical protein